MNSQNAKLVKRNQNKRWKMKQDFTRIINGFNDEFLREHKTSKNKILRNIKILKIF